MIQSAMVETDLPSDPDDPIWNDFCVPTEIMTGPQLMKTPRQWVPSTLSLTVRSIFNKTHIAFLVEWDDRTGAQDSLFRDALALQFPNKLQEGTQKPHFAMGAMGGAVNIWRWQADYNPEAQKVGFQNLLEISGGSTFKEFNAKGFKARPTLQPIDSQMLQGNSVWHNGKWKVVFSRSLLTNSKKDIQFETNKNIPMAFATWEATHNDIGGKHNVATWYYLILLTPESNAIYVYIAMAVLMAVGAELWFVARLRRTAKKPDDKFLNFDFSNKGY